MTSSTSITKIAVALVKAQSEMGNAKKDAINPFFKKSYADLNSVREATLPSLNKFGIVVLQPTCVLNGVDYVETLLIHESGEFISGFTKIVTDKPNDAQRHGSGLSYARRYGLQSMLSIGAEDDDANVISGDPAPVKIKVTAPWHPTPEDLAELNNLIRGSILDGARQQVAADAVLAATTPKELAKIKTRLLTLQTPA